MTRRLGCKAKKPSCCTRKRCGGEAFLSSVLSAESWKGGRKRCYFKAMCCSLSARLCETGRALPSSVSLVICKVA